MKHSTLKICENSETMGVRDAIKNQIEEDRFYGYAKLLTNNASVMSVAKQGCEKTMAEYLRQNQNSLNIPVKLTNRGFRRMGAELVRIAKGA